MIQFDLPKEKSSILKVIGVGGGGGNAVNFMHSQEIEGVNFIICNTDSQALAHSGIPNKVQLGPHLTQGLGAGANPEIGRQATEESLEEIRKILEVNTKMVFITAGMGGGTGTGGAPIIAKVCKDLGILTVGIVTTPFAYEGKKRQLQAEEGINTLKGYVDTLLVISNDKLRHQFGNLKMREAFEKADNVLATAARCITDVISSTGQINVDFADVCTVMKDGGVAILGNAEAAGENRAQIAIEEAINSPLLNDSDIRGAKWILININSAVGEHEYTMDEVEVIQNYLLEQAGEGTDLILGMGYDNSLDDKIGITLIATGFDHKDPFAKSTPKKKEAEEEKIVMVLEQPKTTEEKVIYLDGTDTTPEMEEENNKEEKVEETIEETAKDETSETNKMEEFQLHEVDEMPTVETPVIDLTDMKDEEDSAIIHFTLDSDTDKEEEKNRKTTVSKMSTAEENESIHSTNEKHSSQKQETAREDANEQTSLHPSSAASGGYLAKPFNIYAEPKAEADASQPSAEENNPSTTEASEEEELLDMQMHIVEKDDISAEDMPLAHQAQSPLYPDVEDAATQHETEEQKRKAAERLHKLRNLSFNIDQTDPNNEFETVPAYIRRNMELYNSQPTGLKENPKVKEFYSKVEVKKEDNNTAQISTINTFLDGEKPD